MALAEVVRLDLDPAEMDGGAVGKTIRGGASCWLRIMFARAFSWAMTSAVSMNPRLPPAWSPW